MEILEHNFNRHFDGIANKVFRSYFIKYQIELLNKNGLYASLHRIQFPQL